MGHVLHPRKKTPRPVRDEIDEKDKRPCLTAFFCYYMDNEDELDMTRKKRLTTLIDRWVQLPQETRKVSRAIPVAANFFD
jgi:hypothetical protein